MAYRTGKGTPGGAGIGGWQPSVKYLLLLVLAEIVLVAVARSLTAHGG